MITVKDLIEALQQCDPDSVVILQEDAEGNGFSPIAGVDGENQGYLAESTYHGTVQYITLTTELKEKGYGTGDCCEGADYQKCVVLWPIN